MTGLAVEGRAPAIPWRLASYNIHGCLGGDGRRDPGRIAAVIRGLNADVVGLQEVYTGGTDLGLADQLDALSRETGLEAVFGAALEREGLSFGNALLTSRPILSVERHDLTVSRREPRAALEVDLEVSGIRLSTFVTHLGLRAGERGRQIDCLLGILERVPRAAVALLGDVNEWNPYSRALRRLSERFGRHPAYPTFPAVRPLLALDRIWFSPREHLVEVRTQQTAVSRKASDHLPLVATIAIGERT